MADVVTEEAVEAAADVVNDDTEEMTHDQMKEEEQAVIQRHIERTEEQIERLEQIENGGDTVAGLNLQQLEVLTSLVLTLLQLCHDVSTHGL